MFRLTRLWPLLLLALANSTTAEEIKLTATDWPPYASAQLYRNGVAIVLTEEALQRAGYITTTTIVPWPQALDSVADGSYDVVTSIWQTDERSEELAFSEPFMRNYIIFIKRSGSSAQFNEPADLQGLRIGVVTDYAYSNQPYDTTGIKISEAGSVQENINLLLKDELDLVLADGRVAAYEIDQMVVAKELTIIRNQFTTRGMRIGVSRQNPNHDKIVTAFDKSIAEMREDGSYNAILATFRVSQ